MTLPNIRGSCGPTGRARRCGVRIALPGGEKTRVLPFWHSMINKALTLLSNTFCNLKIPCLTPYKGTIDGRTKRHSSYQIGHTNCYGAEKAFGS